jgi:hypothetical protein
LALRSEQDSEITLTSSLVLRPEQDCDVVVKLDTPCYSAPLLRFP